MDPSRRSSDHDDRRIDPYQGYIGLMVMWRDGSLTCGGDATEVLRNVRSPWRTSALTGLRRMLADYADIAPPKRGETNRRFLDRLEAAGLIKIFDVDRHFPEFNEPPFDDAA